MENLETEKKRIHLLDEIRGLAVFCMVFYHGFYIFGEVFGFEYGTTLFDFFMPVEPFFAGIFIAVCGISCSLSHSNFKRGLKVLAAALGFNLITIFVMPAMGFEECEIYFGILNFLSAAILIYAVSAKKVNKISPVAGIIACAVLYPFFSGIDKGVLNYGTLFVLEIPRKLYASDWLMPIGIYSPYFSSADYFPLLPDIFIFFAGVFAGRYFTAKGFPQGAYKKRVPFLSWLGKKAFVVYIVHMPIIAGIAYIFDLILH